MRVCCLSLPGPGPAGLPGHRKRAKGPRHQLVISGSEVGRPGNHSRRHKITTSLPCEPNRVPPTLSWDSDRGPGDGCEWPRAGMTPSLSWNPDHDPPAGGRGREGGCAPHLVPGGGDSGAGRRTGCRDVLRAWGPAGGPPPGGPAAGAGPCGNWGLRAGEAWGLLCSLTTDQGAFVSKGSWPGLPPGTTGSRAQ